MMGVSCIEMGGRGARDSTTRETPGRGDRWWVTGGNRRMSIWRGRPERGEGGVGPFVKGGNLFPRVPMKGDDGEERVARGRRCGYGKGRSSQWGDAVGALGRVRHCVVVAVAG